MFAANSLTDVTLIVFYKLLGNRPLNLDEERYFPYFFSLHITQKLLSRKNSWLFYSDQYILFEKDLTVISDRLVNETEVKNKATDKLDVNNSVLLESF